MAFWMGSEIYSVGGSKVAVMLTPGVAGVFKVPLNDEAVYDKSETGRYPTLPDLKELKAKVANMLDG